MSIVLGSLAVLLALAILAILAAWITGLQQPSQRIYRHASVIFVALRQENPADDPATGLMAEDALWKSRALFTLVGEGEAYWTDYVILPAGADIASRLRARSGFADLFVAEIELTQVPAILPGMLRLQHLFGLTRRPPGHLPTSLDAIAGRRELLPTMAAIERAQALAPQTPVAMVNFLEYYSPRKGDRKEGREAYLRYGREAFKAVHAVGGQFLFAGRIKAVLVAPRSLGWQEPWDDVAAMIYPDSTAIFAMEQMPDYRKGLGDRDEGLKRTRVIATRAY